MDLCLLSNKYGQKLVDTAKKSVTDAIKTTSKRAIQKLQRQVFQRKNLIIMIMMM